MPESPKQQRPSLANLDKDLEEALRPRLELTTASARAAEYLRRELANTRDQSDAKAKAPADAGAKRPFSMSLDDTIFWIGLTTFGAGLAFLAEHRIYSLVLILVGLAALAWANRRYVPKPPLRLGALIIGMLITCGVAGYDIYDRHFGNPSQPVATGKIWEPLTDQQRSSLELVLGTLPKRESFQVICMTSDCRALANDFMHAAYVAGWSPLLSSGGIMSAEPYGIALYMKDVNDRSLADAIQKSTGLKIEHIYQTSFPNLKSIFIGIHP